MAGFPTPGWILEMPYYWLRVAPRSELSNSNRIRALSSCNHTAIKTARKQDTRIKTTVNLERQTIDFEDEYMDVLQNIEFAIVSIYEEPDLTDYEVQRALETLSSSYIAEKRNRAPKKTRLTE